MHSALVVGGIVAFWQEFGDWHKLISLGFYCVDDLWQGFGGVGGTVVHKDDASVLKFGGYFIYHFCRTGVLPVKTVTIRYKSKEV